MSSRPICAEDEFDDVVDVLGETIADEDAILLGRAMFEEWSQFWPESDMEPFALFINGHPKYVVSHTLDSVDSWDNSILLGEPLAGRLADLKAQPGGTIGVHGSISLVNSLLADGLLDELRLLVFPVWPAVGVACSRAATHPCRSNSSGRRPRRSA